MGSQIFLLGMGANSQFAAEALVLILAMMSNRIASCDPVKKNNKVIGE